VADLADFCGRSPRERVWVQVDRQRVNGGLSDLGHKRGRVERKVGVAMSFGSRQKSSQVCGSRDPKIQVKLN